MSKQLANDAAPNQLFEQRDLQLLFREYQKWIASHTLSYYIIFDMSTTYWGTPLNRYIVVKGFEIDDFFGIVTISTISGNQQLLNPIRCSSKREASIQCRRLNAQYVHDNEPERFATSPTWQEDFALYCAK